MNAKNIINPSAGRQFFQRNVARIIEKLSREKVLREVSTVYTHGAGDAFETASRLRPGEVDFVLAVGGDGTVNEVINGLIRSGSQIPLSILPAGTVNDFAYAMRLPRDVTPFCAMIKEFRVVPIDVGKAGDQYFLNVAAGGMLTDVAYKVPSESKTVLGRMAYYIEGAVNLPSQIYRSIPFHVKAEGVDVCRDSLLFTVSNTTSVGGFRKLAPKASTGDGLLDVMVVHKPAFGDFMPLVVQLMLGEHDRNPIVTYFQTTRVEIQADIEDPVQLDLDGERGGALPVTIECVPSAIKLIVPKP
ncbi:MAG: YegS/Rv2252/BmrU family lipid kinase [Clostridiaceae bacterium]|nr:YegS/Rv2252/BmrU family lipid kinase [Clostridiaceae bacterium]